MRFAIHDGERREASPGATGTCPGCDASLSPKCGRIVRWHWAHRRGTLCDPWWENETNWHRQWKDHFPSAWQEVPQRDQISNEWHFADVRTDHGLVLEFQHSPLHPAELSSRETFYGNMLWIVDGLRGPLDKSYFEMGLSRPLQQDPLAYAVRWWSRSRLLPFWGTATKPVYLDFGGDFLWRLIFYRSDSRTGAVGPILRSAFVEACRKGRPVPLLALDPPPNDDKVGL